MGELYDDGFSFRFPLWMVAGPHGEIQGVEGTNGERCLPLFTDENLAGRFREAIKQRAGYKLLSVPTAEALVNIIDHLEQKGFDHAFFDHPGIGVGAPVGARLVSIGGLRKLLQSDE